MAALLHLTPGATFAGAFRVVQPLSEGGMGAVYVVEQTSTGTQRALKIMHPQLVADERMRQRFVQEAKVGALVDSDHVVQVLDAGVDAQSGTPWLTMELLKGETLTQAIERTGPFEFATARDVFSQVCHAIGAAHDVGLIHRDLKPDNIFLAASRREGATFLAKVLDFGIAS
ncbi:MAG: serine/threonine-protein kinase [Polyangiales bacterium]